MRIFVEHIGQPGLIVSHESIGEGMLRVLRFGSHQLRRDYLRHLLTFPPEERLRVFLEAQSNPGTGFYVETLDTSRAAAADFVEAPASSEDDSASLS